MNLRKALSSSQKAFISASNIENQNENKEVEDDKILNEMVELTCYGVQEKTCKETSCKEVSQGAAFSKVLFSYFIVTCTL